MHSRLAICLLGSASIVATAPHRGLAQQSSTPLDFSGVIFGSYSYRTDSAAKAGLGGQNPNSFNVDRAYLNFRMPAGENGLIRITTDVFQNTNGATNGFYQGWAVRIKYGYLQYTGLRNDFGAGSSLTGRVGILHNVIIDHEETFWPRYLQQVGVERFGFFSSADAGVAGLLTLGNKWGEIYGTVVNGPGYTSFERDRFKDFALRVSLTPFANGASGNALLKSFAISPWFYKGWVGSGFAAGGAGQVGPGTNGAVVDGLQRDRWGVFAGVKDRRLTAGVEYAQRADESETGLNTSATPRVLHDSTGRLIDGFIVARPLEWIDGSKQSRLGVVARYDRFTPNTDATAPAYAGTTPAYNFWILGLSYDLNARMTFALDWQAQSPSDFPAFSPTTVHPAPRLSTISLHWQAQF